MAVIETNDLSKRYRRVEALRGVTLRVQSGEIYGLLGQNGAGKTTLIKILLGIARYWRGEAYLLGSPAGTVKVRRRVGYLPEDHRFPPYHTASSLLDFYGRLYGIERRERRRRIPEYLDLVGLRDRADSKIRTYSKGMKQRVGIAQALFHEPEVIFLDEPTDGVDPLGRRQIREMLQRLKARGKTIFLNSHLLGEVELVCDRVGILRAGRLIREGGVEELTHQRGFFGIRLAQGQDFPVHEIERLGFKVNRLTGDLWEVEVPEERSIDEVVDCLRGRNLSIRYLMEKKQTLEEMFLATVSDHSESTSSHEASDLNQGRN